VGILTASDIMKAYLKLSEPCAPSQEETAIQTIP
jgi:hypothetical protein